MSGCYLVSMNARIHKSTKFSPHELMFGRQHDPIQNSLAEYRELTEREERANININHSHSMSKHRYDSIRRNLNISLEDLVLVERSDRCRKLSDRYEGPLKVVSREKDISKLLDNRGKIRERHVSQIKLYKEGNMIALIALL